MADTRRDALDALVRQTFGSTASIVQIDKLSRRAAAVARLHLRHAHVESVIAKFTPEALPLTAALDSKNVEFAEELLAQRFLATLPMADKIKPDLLAFAPEGLFLLEDLGPEGSPSMREYGYLIPRLAQTLATLHVASRPHLISYSEMRAAAHLGNVDDDRRRYGKPAYRSLYALGCEFIRTRYEITALRNNQAAIEQELQQVEQAISEPGPFLTFIHDDLGNARQTFEVDDRLYLLDFEYAKFSHALLDFAKPMIGKFEMSLETGVYEWTGPHFPLELIEHYRRLCETNFSLRFDNQDWRRAVDAALTYGAITLVGQLCRWEPEHNLQGTVKQNITGILGYLAVLLAKTGGLPALQTFINSYAREQ